MLQVAINRLIDWPHWRTFPLDLRTSVTEVSSFRSHWKKTHSWKPICNRQNILFSSHVAEEFCCRNTCFVKFYLLTCAITVFKRQSQFTVSLKHLKSHLLFFNQNFFFFYYQLDYLTCEINLLSFTYQ